MKLCYQVATPDVAIAESVTAYQGSLEKTFGDLAKLGYDGVELMTIDPDKLSWDDVKATAKDLNLDVDLVCTGELFGQLGLSFTSPDVGIRKEAIAHVKRIIDFAAFLNARINIGRVRGQYLPGVPREQTEAWAIEAFKEISSYAQPKKVDIALETVTIMQTNFINTMAEGVAMVEKVGFPNFRMMMDIFHLNLEEKNLYEAIRNYIPHSIHVHLSDNNRRYPGHCGLDFEKIIQIFYDSGYDGSFCTEIMQLPSMEEAATGAIRHLSPIFNKIYNRSNR